MKIEDIGWLIENLLENWELLIDESTSLKVVAFRRKRSRG